MLPSQPHSHAKNESYESDVHTAPRHAVEYIQRRKTPKRSAYSPGTQYAILNQVNQTQHEGERERRIRPSVQRNVEREHRPTRNARYRERARGKNSKRGNPADQQ